MSEIIYLVYRVYSRKEREDPDQRSWFYGWSTSKNVIKAFKQQRDNKKYKIIKIDADERLEYDLFPNIENPDQMIDYVKLKTAANHEEIHFFTTLSELKEAEGRIQSRFHDLCSIPDMYILKMFMHLDRYYLDALELLGFKPKEVDVIYDTSDGRDNYNTLELVKDEIDDAYDGMAMSPPEDPERYKYVPGLLTISQVGDKLLYSMENFITALRDDL